MAKLLNRSLVNESEFERVELAGGDWEARLKPYLSKRTKVVVPEIRLYEIPALEDFVAREGYEVRYVLIDGARGIGKAYLIPQ